MRQLNHVVPQLAPEGRWLGACLQRRCGLQGNVGPPAGGLLWSKTKLLGTCWQLLLNLCSHRLVLLKMRGVFSTYI